MKTFAIVVAIIVAVLAAFIGFNSLLMTPEQMLEDATVKIAELRVKIKLGDVNATFGSSRFFETAANTRYVCGYVTSRRLAGPPRRFLFMASSENVAISGFDPGT